MKKLAMLSLLLISCAMFAQDVHIDCANINPCTLTPSGGIAWSGGNVTWIFTPVSPNESIQIYIHNRNISNGHTSQTVQVFQTGFGKPTAPSLTNNADFWLATNVTQNTISGASCNNIAANNPTSVGASGTGTCSVNAVLAGQVAIKMSGATTSAGSPDTFDISIIQWTGTVSGAQPGSLTSIRGTGFPSNKTCGGGSCDNAPAGVYINGKQYFNPSSAPWSAEFFSPQVLYDPQGNPPANTFAFGMSTGVTVPDGNTANLSNVSIINFDVSPDHWGSGPLGAMVGVLGQAFVDGTGTATNIIAYDTSFGGRGTNIFGMRITTPYSSGGVTTNVYGLDIQDVHGIGTNNYAIRVEDQTNNASAGQVSLPHTTLRANAFANFPPCSASFEGTIARVNNSNTAVVGANVAGGGANHVNMLCDGTNWRVYTTF